MSNVNNKYRFLFAGGGTGGHLYPAIAVAQAILELKPEAEVLFVGSKNKIEGNVIPKLGFKFRNISVRGFNRQLSIKNLLFPIYLFISLFQALAIAMKFKPKVSIGTGGYVAGPAIWAASVMGSKIILVEPNSYPGITTRLLEKYADEIHISFEYTKKFLRRQNILKLTGNPVRSSLTLSDKKIALSKFNLSDKKKTVLIIGGSLGAQSLNNAVKNSLEKFSTKDIQIIWQVGSRYYEVLKVYNSESIKVLPFIENMSDAFSACDLVVARAGASTIAEISLLGLPAILVPSPNVAENHQYHNSKALVDENAVVMIEDKNVNEKLFDEISNLIFDEVKLSHLSDNVKRFAKPDASYQIAKNAINYVEMN